MTTTATPAAPITSVPFSKLVAPDDINARVATKDDLDELAASIKAIGLIQPLVVRPAEGGDKYEIFAGRRRFMAISRLVKDKAWKKSDMVAVTVRNEDDAGALEISLAENMMRLPPHPVDQYEAFARLAQHGKATSDIAATFGITERTVRQHMALGRLAPVIRDAWRKGKLEAKVAQAFAGAPEATQAAVWEIVRKQSYIDAYHVREKLYRGRMSAHQIPERTLAIYRERGGTLTEDLFDEHRYVDDPLLLAAIRREQAAVIKAEVEAEGWGWVAVDRDLPEDYWQWKQLETPWPTEAEAKRHAELLEALRQTKPGSDAHAAAEQAITDHDNAVELRGWPPELRATAGAVLEIDNDGGVTIVRGFIRQEGAEGLVRDAGGDDEAMDDDLPSADETVHHTDADEDDESTKISAALMHSLTELQTRAAQRVMAADPKLALRALIASQRVAQWASPVKVNISNVLAPRSSVVTDNDFGAALADTANMTLPDMLSMLAPLIANGIDMIAHSASSDRSDHDELIAAMPAGRYLSEMRDEFLPGDYFRRVPKALALAAIDEMREAGCAGGLAPEDVLADMKKADLAVAAAEAAAACGWLPPEIRHPDYALAEPARVKVRVGAQ